MTPDAIVLDATERSALATVRSLGAGGLQVWAAASRPDPLAGASRWCRKTVLVPDPKQSASAFSDAVSDLMASHPSALVFPTTDPAITALLNSPEVPVERLACAPAAAYDSLSDKASLIRLAARLGIRTPDTHIGSDRAELESIIAHAPEPVVLKPARSWYLADDRMFNTSVFIAPHRTAAIDHVRRQEWVEHVPCLVQGFVEGSGAGVFTLFGQGRPWAWFAHRRVREKPPEGGVSVLSESVAVDDRLKELSNSLFSEAGWFGPAMAEFRVTPSGEPYLMEVNGRFWGSLQLAIDSGVDFPWLLYCLMAGRPVEPVLGFRTGRRLRWLLGDFDSLYLTLRKRNVPLSEKLRRAASFLNFFSPSTRLEVLRSSDPRPFLREARLWLRALR